MIAPRANLRFTIHDHVIREAEHLKKLDRIFFHLRKDDFCSGVGGGINDAEKDRDAYAVDYIGMRKIDDELFVTLVETALAFALDMYARYLIQIITGEHDGAFFVGYG